MLRHSRGLPGLRAGLQRILACCGLALLFSAFPSFAQSTAGLKKNTQATPTTQTPQASSAAQQAQFEGELEVLHQDDFKNKKSHTQHLLRTADGKRYELKFKTHAPHYPTGTKVKVKGALSGNTLAFASGDSSSVQVLAMAALPNTIGPQSTLVILANYQDQPTNYTNSDTGQPITVSGASSLVFGTGAGTVNGFFAENSYGQTSITGKAVGWYTLPINSTTCDFPSLSTNAKQAATAAGVNLSAYTRIVYVTPFNAACAFAGAALVGGTESWINGSFDVNVISHELGHNLGLQHSHSLYCPDGSIIGNGVLYPVANNTACSLTEYGDRLDTMGPSSPEIAPHFNVFQKERLGWLNTVGMPPITTVTTSGSYTIDPYESLGSNPKALKIFKGLDAYGYKTWYYVEFRQSIGVDGFLATANILSYNSSNILNGVVIHAYSENQGGDAGFLLDMTPTTIEGYPKDPALVVGQSFTDAVAGVTISTAWANGSNAGVTVTLSGSSGSSSTCTRANPSVLLSSAQSTTVAAGTAVSYSVAVTNNDSSACGSSAFNLQSVLPSGWSGGLASSALTVSPGSAASTTFTVTSATSALVGSYSVSAKATNGASSASTATGTATYTVGSTTTATTTTTSGKGKGRTK